MKWVFLSVIIHILMSNLKELTEKEQEREIVKLNNLVEGIIGERPKYFRAPFEMNTDHSKKVAEK